MNRPRAALALASAFAALLAGCPSEPPRAPAPVEAVAIAVPAAPEEEPATPPPDDDEEQGAPGGAPAEAAVAGGAPAFSLDSVNGAGKAALVRGRVTVVHFWATWCAPCKVSFPKLQALYAKHKGDGLVVIALSVDEEDSGVAAFAAASGVRFPVAWDKGQSVATQWKPSMMPSTFIVDRAGVIRAEHKGYVAGQEVEIEAEVRPLL